MDFYWGSLLSPTRKYIFRKVKIHLLTSYGLNSKSYIWKKIIFILKKMLMQYLFAKKWIHLRMQNIYLAINKTEKKPEKITQSTIMRRPSLKGVEKENVDKCRSSSFPIWNISDGQTSFSGETQEPCITGKIIWFVSLFRFSLNLSALVSCLGFSKW